MKAGHYAEHMLNFSPKIRLGNRYACL